MKPLGPFKFNHALLKEEDFRRLINENWKLFDPLMRKATMFQLIFNSNKVEKLVACWEKKEVPCQANLLEIENKITSLLS